MILKKESSPHTVLNLSFWSIRHKFPPLTGLCQVILCFNKISNLGASEQCAFLFQCTYLLFQHLWNCFEMCVFPFGLYFWKDFHTANETLENLRLLIFTWWAERMPINNKGSLLSPFPDWDTSCFPYIKQIIDGQCTGQVIVSLRQTYSVTNSNGPEAGNVHEPEIKQNLWQIWTWPI